MEHIVTFLMLFALMCAVTLITVTLMLQRQFRHKASIWFAVAVSGLGCFVLEILIYRYGKSLSSSSIQDFSKLWALFGAMSLTVATPRLTRLMTGLPKRIPWLIAEIALPFFALVGSSAFILGTGGAIWVYFLQCLVFATVGGGILFIGLVRPKERGKTQNRFLIRLLLWSSLCLPLIILDAFGGILPPWFNDLPISLFLPGLLLLSISEIPGFLGAPVYMQAGQPSRYFFERFSITKREAEIVHLVVSGVTNAQIAERLFISGKTVENHLTNIFRKTGIKNRIQLFRLINSSSD